MPQIAPTSTSIRPLRRSLAVSALAAMLLAAALATPAAGYHAYLDLRSPDARDAARPAEAPQDLRSPDARDAVYPPAAYQDLRSPDARDAGSPMPQAPSSSAAPSNDFTWGYLAVGGLGLIALAGLVATIGRRRRRLEEPVVGLRA